MQTNIIHLPDLYNVNERNYKPLKHGKVKTHQRFDDMNSDQPCHRTSYCIISFDFCQVMS